VPRCLGSQIDELRFHTSALSVATSTFSSPISMASQKLIPCRFFILGICKKGDSCDFNHERPINLQPQFGANSPALPQRLKSNHSDPFPLHERTGSTPTCRFFLRGLCNKGDNCRYIHAQSVVSSQEVERLTKKDDFHLPSSSPGPISSDFRGSLPCKFFSRHGGCRNVFCPYLHDSDHTVEANSFVDSDVEMGVVVCIGIPVLYSRTNV
jgi:CCCH-type zinc finger protein/zinc finger (C-x8-C-x5-C-x3-H type) protein/Nab2-type zinc finger RNA-binding protein